MSQWKVYKSNHIYFVTTSIVEWQSVFTENRHFQILIEGLKYGMANKGLHLHGFVIMPNHAHYIVSTSENKNLSNIMRDINTHTSREITKLLNADNNTPALSVFQKAADEAARGNQCKVWQDGFHPIALETRRFFKQKLDYIHDNPVRKGLVEKPEDWIYSSARNYLLEDHSIIEVEPL